MNNYNKTIHHNNKVIQQLADSITPEEEKKNRVLGRWFSIVSKLLPGDHIHYTAPDLSTVEIRQEIMKEAENKRLRKQLKRIKDGRASAV